MNRYFKSAYLFGLLGGIMGLISFIVLTFLREDPTNLNLIFGYVIVPISLYLALRYFKDYTNSGYISFAEGMSVGFVTYMFIALLSFVGIWLILNLSPDLFELIKASKVQALIESKETIVSQVGTESYDATLESVQNMVKTDIAINDSIWKIIPGLFFTIIISIILRKNPN
ncbi:DUF4199 domain-containing protein [Algoriphagus pacificus]|uniref:DUF4199 domain-containing protein n=1 Tax=Algoriphagus pacificus TaxID=2811234 RepID=A0ABS3CLE9_9BACT|nr:DUF4199 domain-containing protein [Algoriphagus pacificus]MBN7817910.1 DUF4199 domain-containing protein [Algoriphagus pacificus]